MAVLKRRASAPTAAPQPEDPAATPAAEPPRKPARLVLGKKPTVPIVFHNPDTTDYRAVVQRYKDKVRNPKTAIRAKCVECSGGSLKEVQCCPVSGCALHPFRMGENPFNKKVRDRLGLNTPDDTGDDADGDED